MELLLQFFEIIWVLNYVNPILQIILINESEICKKSISTYWPITIIIVNI